MKDWLFATLATFGVCAVVFLALVVPFSFGPEAGFAALAFYFFYGFIAWGVYIIRAERRLQERRRR